MRSGKAEGGPTPATRLGGDDVTVTGPSAASNPLSLEIRLPP